MTYELFDPLANPHRECSCCGSRQKHFICKDCHVEFRRDPSLRIVRLPKELLEEWLSTTCEVCGKLRKNHTDEELKNHEKMLEEIFPDC